MTATTKRVVGLLSMAVALAILSAVAIQLQYGRFGSVRVQVFTGGGPSGDGTTRTPVFNVEHDWGLEIELGGVFRGVTLRRPDDNLEDGSEELLPLFNQGRRIEEIWPRGGEYYLEFHGSGSWRVVIRAEGIPK
ncbi:MAG TPA: hypothetical protein VNC50_07205 [Planctomycetia bacterium]|nr:hypothetical protein [Planctomycetia bacterium]